MTTCGYPKGAFAEWPPKRPVVMQHVLPFICCQGFVFIDFKFIFVVVTARTPGVSAGVAASRATTMASRNLLAETRRILSTILPYAHLGLPMTIMERPFGRRPSGLVVSHGYAFPIGRAWQVPQPR